MRTKPMLRAGLLTISLLTGCATNSFVTDVSCKAFAPINASKLDTDPTKRQVIGHNRAYTAICKA